MTTPDAPNPGQAAGSADQSPIDFTKPAGGSAPTPAPGYGSSPYGQPPAGDPAAGNPVKPYQQPYGAANYGAAQPDSSPYGSQPYGGPAPYGQPASPYGAYPGADASAPFGRDPYTGEPLSDKSKVAAGLLQIFLGGFGVGRFYLGDNKTGGLMLGLTVVGWITSIFIVGIFIVLGVSIWALVDGIMMLTGSVKDPQGRKLRS